MAVFSKFLDTAYEKCHIFYGAPDILVVEQEDGEFRSSNWYVQFGLFQGSRESIRPRKKVAVAVNGEGAGFDMYLNRDGRAYFLEDDVMDHSPRETKDCAVLSPSSRQLASLRLEEGSNKVTFTRLFSQYLGQTQFSQIEARIYLWKWNARVVIVDVDGTVTKSDALGQIKPFFGQDWTQPGVAQLLSAIKENGYEVMFLSARPIAQALYTRRFLENIKQDGQRLPDGPVVVSPDRLFPTFWRELVIKTPQEFKIRCLQDTRSLFPPGTEPLYAGFGNRSTDELSYVKAGIPKGMIFIVNPKGEVMINNQVDIESYTSLHKRVDDMFPAIRHQPRSYSIVHTITSKSPSTDLKPLSTKMGLPKLRKELKRLKQPISIGFGLLRSYILSTLWPIEFDVTLLKGKIGNSTIDPVIRDDLVLIVSQILIQLENMCSCLWANVPEDYYMDKFGVEDTGRDYGEHIHHSDLFLLGIK